MKVLLVDDHQLIREGLRPAMRQLVDAGSGEEVTVLEASSFTQAREIARAHPDLDLVLLDLHLPDVAGFAALAGMQRDHPAIPVVVVSGEDDPELVRAAFEHGALGYVPKSSSSAVLVGALRLVLAGGTYLPREIMAAGAAISASPSAAREGFAGLDITPRQADVLRLLLAGKSNKVICRELGLAEGTVKNHLAAIFKALNVASRVEAIVAAGKLGLKA